MNTCTKELAPLIHEYIRENLGKPQPAKEVRKIIQDYVSQKVTDAFANAVRAAATVQVYGTEADDMKRLEALVTAVNKMRGQKCEYAVYTASEMREKLIDDEKKEFKRRQKAKKKSLKDQGKTYVVEKWKKSKKGLIKLKKSPAYTSIKDGSKYFKHLLWSPVESTSKMLPFMKRVSDADGAHRLGTMVNGE